MFAEFKKTLPKKKAKVRKVLFIIMMIMFKYPYAFLKKKPNKEIEIKEFRRTKEGGATKIPSGKKIFSDIRKFSVKIRRIKAMKFYYDVIIHGFEVTYTDYFETEYKKEHIIYSIVN